MNAIQSATEKVKEAIVDISEATQILTASKVAVDIPMNADGFLKEGLALHKQAQVLREEAIKELQLASGHGIGADTFEHLHKGNALLQKANALMQQGAQCVTQGVDAVHNTVEKVTAFQLRLQEAIKARECALAKIEQGLAAVTSAVTLLSKKI